MRKPGAPPSRFRSLAVLAARAADDKKAESVSLFKVKTSNSLTDYVLVANAGSPAQLEAVEEKVTQVLESGGFELLHREGSHSGLWRVLDYGGLMVHLMHPEARLFYALDKLYVGAFKVRWRALDNHRRPPRRR